MGVSTGGVRLCPSLQSFPERIYWSAAGCNEQSLAFCSFYSLKYLIRRLGLKFDSFTAFRRFSSSAQDPNMRILVLGSGGREHALVWKLSQSTAVEKIFLAPGNGGSYQEQRVINVDLSIADFPALVKFATGNEVRPRSFRSPRP